MASEIAGKTVRTEYLPARPVAAHNRASCCSWRMSGICQRGRSGRLPGGCPFARGGRPSMRWANAVLPARPVPVGQQKMAVSPGLAAGPVMPTDDGSGSGWSGGTQTIPSLKPAEPIPNAALKRSSPCGLPG
jgi:hypothetical protein